jgi:flagellar basal body L-ring protein FlgH
VKFSGKSDSEYGMVNGEDYGLFSGYRSIWIALGAAALLFLFSGCSSIMGGLRPDLDDEYRYEREPTVGGRFSEGGLLDEGRGPASDLGHAERRGTSVGRMGGQGSWLQEGEDDRNALRRPNEREDEEDGPKLAARPTMMKKYKNGSRATRDDFIDDLKSDGSLWTSDGQTNYFLTKNKTKTEGDIITVATDEEFIRDVAAEIKRTLNNDEREAELDLAQERMRRKAMGLPEDATEEKVASAQASADRKPASDSASADEPQRPVDIPNVTWAELDLRKSIEMKAGDPVMMEVLDRYPNGNYKLRGLKRVRMHGKSRMVSVLAIAKAADISDDESIPSAKLYEYRIEAVK